MSFLTYAKIGARFVAAAAGAPVTITPLPKDATVISGGGELPTISPRTSQLFWSNWLARLAALAGIGVAQDQISQGISAAVVLFTLVSQIYREAGGRPLLPFRAG